MYSCAFNPFRATVRTMPQTPALGCVIRSILQVKFCFKAYKTPRLRPHATVIFSLRFMFRSQMINHGRIAKEKSATTNQAKQRLELDIVSRTWVHLHPTVRPTLEKSSQHFPSTVGFQVFSTGMHCTTTVMLAKSVMKTVPAKKAQMNPI